MERKLIKRIIKIKLAFKLIKATRKIIIPGFEGLSIYVVSKFFFRGLKNGAINMRATSLAFSFFLALFPSIIFLFTLIPYIPIDSFKENLFELLQQLMPASAFKAAEETIADIINNQRGGLLSIGFFSALYFSTNGFNAMINAFNESYHEVESRRPIFQRLVAVFMVIISVILISIAISLIIFSELALNSIGNNTEYGFVYHLLLLGKWGVLLLLCFAFISVNYYLGPKRKKDWKFFSVGSWFATILTVVTSLAFSYYVNNFGNYNKLYGSIGTLIVIMLWLYINSLILLLGFDLNASIRSAIKQQKIYESKKT